MNVLIPMAGAGSRFADAGYTFPKPLIEVEGKPMIQRVVENLGLQMHRHIFIVNKDHFHKYNLGYLLTKIAPGCLIEVVDHVTEGAACTTLLAKELINDSEPLLIANSDQIVEWGIGLDVSKSDWDGLIYTHKAIHPKWSFARTYANGEVCEVAEKKPISDDATVGVYYFNQGQEYVRFAEEMIENDDRVNGEFYVCPVYNWAIKHGYKVGISPVNKMWGIGTPEDLKVYLDR